jgi:hypothetical protein
MNSNVIAALIIAGAILVLSVVLFLTYEQRMRVREQVVLERHERDEKERKRKLQIEQRQAGHMVFAELSQAALQNTVHNLLPDGNLVKTAGPIEVERREQNGGLGYTIIVSQPDQTSSARGGLQKAGHTLCQININLEKTGEEIHVLHAPYGPERDYSRQEFDEVRDKLYEWIQTWRGFSDPRPSTALFQS